MYSDENVQNKWLKSGEHSGKTWADCKHELLKYRKYIFTISKLKILNEGELKGIKKVFQVGLPSYLKYLILGNSLNSDHSLFEDCFDRKNQFWSFENFLSFEFIVLK